MSFSSFVVPSTTAPLPVIGLETAVPLRITIIGGGSVVNDQDTGLVIALTRFVLGSARLRWPCKGC